MRKDDMEKRCEQLIEVFQIKFRKKSEWSEPRTWTSWGTKTKKGAIAVIEKIMYENDTSINLLEMCEGIYKTIDISLRDWDGENISTKTLTNIRETLRTAIMLYKMEKEGKI